MGVRQWLFGGNTYRTARSGLSSLQSAAAHEPHQFTRSIDNRNRSDAIPFDHFIGTFNRCVLRHEKRLVHCSHYIADATIAPSLSGNLLQLLQRKNPEQPPFM